MKKVIAVLSAIGIMLAGLSGCSLNINEYLGTVKDVNVTPTEVQKAGYTWTSAYAEIINICLSRYGQYTEAKDDDGNVESASGVFFCNLLDWNSDSVPELLIGCSDGSDGTKITDFQIYSFTDGCADAVLSEKPGTDSDGAAEIRIYRSEDGTYSFIISHNSDDGEQNDYSIYTYADGKVECTTLYYGTVPQSEESEETTAEEKTTAAEETTAAEDETEAESETEAEEETEEETTEAQAHSSGDFSYFAINGESCSQAEFASAVSEAKTDSETVIDCTAAKDVSVINAFLSGTATAYTDELTGITYSSENQ